MVKVGLGCRWLRIVVGVSPCLTLAPMRMMSLWMGLLLSSFLLLSVLSRGVVMCPGASLHAGVPDRRLPMLGISITCPLTMVLVRLAGPRRGS